jgi:hypothetical protein
VHGRSHPNKIGPQGVEVSLDRSQSAVEPLLEFAEPCFDSTITVHVPMEANVAGVSVKSITRTRTALDDGSGRDAGDGTGAARRKPLHVTRGDSYALPSVERTKPLA